MSNVRPAGCLLLLLAALLACAADAPERGGDHCLQITLTGTQGGPPAVNGLAGAGTLIQFGRESNDCRDTLLQFDVGRGTTERLSQLEISPNQIDAVFLTHLHSDHTEGLAGLLQLRWHFLGDDIDVVCSGDVAANRPPPSRTMSCRGLIEHTGDALLHAGEIAQRHAENNRRDPRGPAAIVNLREVGPPLPSKPGAVVWKSDEVRVSAIATTHIAGSLAYRIDTPAGSVVIGGDAGNSKAAPPRLSSTSETVEMLSRGADVLVHSAIHPAFEPGGGSRFPAPVYYRQSTVTDLAALAERTGLRHLLLTHLIPSLDAESHGPFAVPAGPLTAADYETAAAAANYSGTVHVGTDLLTIRLP